MATLAGTLTKLPLALEWHTVRRGDYSSSLRSFFASSRDISRATENWRASLADTQ